MAAGTKKESKRNKVLKPIQIIEDDTARRERMMEIIAENEKRFGKYSLNLISSDSIEKSDIVPGAISFGIPQADRSTNAGGVPPGRIVEIMGPESSGKTTMCLYLMAEVQRKGGIAAFIDLEHALDPAHAKGCGVKELLSSQPNCGEEAFDIIRSLIPVCNLVIVDSIAAMVPKAEVEGSSGDGGMALHARLMSSETKKIVGPASKHKCTVVFINQIRHKVGIMFGNPETTTGGNAMKFYASIRLDFRRREAIKIGDLIVGNEVEIKTIKSKCSTPYGKDKFYMYFDGPRTIAANTLEFCVSIGQVEKAGTWYSYNNNRLGQGRENVVDFLLSNEDLLNELRVVARDHLFDPYVISSSSDSID